MLSDKSDSARLCFDSQDDVINYAKKVVEDSNGWLAVHDVNIAHRYKSGDCEIYVRCTSELMAKDFHFIFHPVPVRRTQCEPSLNIQAVEVDCASAYGDGADNRMFVGVSEFVETPQGVIPSLVWLEPANEVNDFLGMILQPPFYCVLKASHIRGNREESVLLRHDSVHGLVKGVPQVGDSVSSDALQGDWHGLSELDLMNFLSSVQVSLYDAGVWVTCHESSNLPFKVTDVFLCPRNAVL